VRLSAEPTPGKQTAPITLIEPGLDPRCGITVVSGATSSNVAEGASIVAIATATKPSVV